MTSKRIVIHHVRGRLTGIRRIVGCTSIEADATFPAELVADEGDGEATFSKVAEHKKYVLYRELNTPSLLAQDVCKP